MLLICHAGRGRWNDWEMHIGKTRLLFADTGFVDIDVAMCATQAGNLAAEAGFPDRARDAWDLATDQWLGLDRPEEANATREKILGLREATPEED